MKRSWLGAALLGFLIGPAPVGAENSETEPRFSHKSTGHVVRGPHFYVWDEDAREAEDWALHLHSGGRPMQASSWRAVAERSAAQPSILSDEDEHELESWTETPGDEHRISALGCLLCLLPSLDRTCLISAWATSPDEQIRCALAHALAAPFEAVGVPTALEHLQQDASDEVRRVARAAQAMRRAPPARAVSGRVAPS